ncbi:hypothetical protein VNI00_018707 [Paramarasmius palmivorus]|uniref:Uncharacterized protein n=1 Tax=Paramarasmius palmivorus TaxID=297713 RepID=A0AAW0AV93_9AGAR
MAPIYAVTWKDPRQIDPACQVAESSGSGIQSPQDDSHATSSHSQAVLDANADTGSGALPEAGQQSSSGGHVESDHAPKNAEVEGLSSVSSSDPQVDTPTSPPSSSSTIQPKEHQAQSSDPPAPTLISPTLRPDNPNRDTQVSSPQDDETLDIRIENTSGDIEDAKNSSAPGRGHTSAGGTSGSSGSLAEDRDDEEVPGSAPAAPSTGDIDMENTNVVRSPVLTEGHNVPQDLPSPPVNEQMNRSAARTEERDTRYSRDTEENVHLENLSVVSGEGHSTPTVGLAHLSDKVSVSERLGVSFNGLPRFQSQDQDPLLSGETSVVHPDNSETTARVRDATSGAPARSGQDDEQAPGSRSEQDVQSSDISQREEDGHTTEGGQTIRAHPTWVDYSDESHAGGHNDAGILDSDHIASSTRDIDTGLVSGERYITSQDLLSPVVNPRANVRLVARSEEDTQSSSLGEERSYPESSNVMKEDQDSPAFPGADASRHDDGQLEEEHITSSAPLADVDTRVDEQMIPNRSAARTEEQDVQSSVSPNVDEGLRLEDKNQVDH